MKIFMNISVLILVLLIFSGCKQSYIQNKNAFLYKNYLKVKELHEYDMKISINKSQIFYNKTKNITFDGYKVSYIIAEDYFSDGGWGPLNISHSDKEFMENWYVKSHKTDYLYILFTLNEEPLEKENINYFKELKRNYIPSKLINKIDGFLLQNSCPIVKHRNDKEKRKSLLQCYAKKLDETTFLIARFAFPNDKSDIKLFNEEIIPTMLKSIKLTPIQISPWKLY